MNRWVGVLIVVALVAIAVVAGERPELVPGNFDVPRLIWLLMALMLVAGAGFGVVRFRYDGGRAFVSILIWGALIVAIMLAYSVFN